MSNDPKKNEPKSTQPNSADSPPPIPPITAGELDDQVFDLSEIQLPELEEPMIEALPLENIAEPIDLSPPHESVTFDIPAQSHDPGSMTVGMSLQDLPDLANIHESTGLSGFMPSADPASGYMPVASDDPASAIPLIPAAKQGSSVIIGSDKASLSGNLEPIAPVAPASGWLDSESDLPPQQLEGNSGLFTEHLEVHQADLLGAAPLVESSDIFSSGPILTAHGADQSDVIAATVHGPTTPDPADKAARPSEIAINFEQPPGGSTLEHEGEGSDLPVADEVPESSENLLDSAKIAEAPPLPGFRFERRDEADYGSTPMATPDASSILSELSDPGEISFDESSAVRLEAPGVDRTYSSNPDEGTEFDLTISDDPVAPELTEAEAASGNDHGPDWREQTGSDLFSEGRSVAEFVLDPDSGRVVPVDSGLQSDQPSLTSAPSSIFSSEKVPGSAGSKSNGGPSSDSVRIGRPADEEEVAVEFSDHPTADPEASSAALAGPLTPDNVKRAPGGKVEFDPPKKTVPTPAAPADEDQESGSVDWGAASVADSEEATLGFPQALIDAPLSGILKRGKQVEEPDEEAPTRLQKALDKSKPSKRTKGKLSKSPTPPPDGFDPSVEIDWMAGSSSEERAIQPEAYEAKPPEKGKDKEKKEPSREKKRLSPARELQQAGGKRGGGGWIGGTLLGMIIAGGACAGLYFGGVIPSPEAKKPQGGNQAGLPTSQPGKQAEPTYADAKAAIDAGDHAKALTVLDAVKSAAGEKATVETKAAIGQARLLAKVQELGKANVAVASGDDKDLIAARKELEAVVNDPDAVKTPEGEKAAVQSTIHLGLTYELVGNWKEAIKVYESGIKSFPKFTTTFQAAIDRVAAITPAAGGTSRRVTPAEIEQLLFAAIFLQADAPAKEDDEAGVYFWKAVKLATDGKYGDAVDEIKKAKAAHIKRAKALAGRGLNPLSDPLEQIFARCCDDLKAYWELRAALYADKSIAELIKRDGIEKTMKALAAAQAKATEAVKLMTDLKAAGDKLAKAEKDLKDAKDGYASKEKELLANEAKTREEVIAAKDSLLKAEAARKTAEETIASVAKELQAAKLLPENYDTAALLAAQKTTVNRATGPTLAALMPPGMMAVGGGGLSAAQLIDLAERLTKSETAVKKLITEKQQITTEYAAETKKLKDSHAADVKKLGEDFAAEMKKATDANAANTTKLKEDQAAELKKMADKFAVDLKKMTDDNAVAAKKLADGFEGKIKDLESAVTKAKAAGDEMAAKLRVDLKNVVSPAQALDLWLPQLSELRRVADADPALANANKVLSTADRDSEDAAKARTVAGLALLLKGNLSEAKEMFQDARSSPAYKTSAGKEWVKAVDIGLASISDPLAPYRLPVEKPKRDLKAAARYLDLGINAYKSGRNAEAVTALIGATKADPTDPVAWYFLGAARWSVGSTDQAKEDYRQGGEWEKISAMSARTISDNLEPIQGAARDALWVARP